MAPVAFDHAMVVAANPLAAQAGAEILRMGGNAVDAAVATAYALNVVEPQSSGIGGGLFMLVYLAQTGDVVTIDGREEAPASATPDLFLRPDGSPRPFFPDRITGGRPVGVPGTVRALEKARTRFGTLSLTTVITPAIRLAADGFAVSERMSEQLELHRDRLVLFPASRTVFFPDGTHPVRPGDHLRQPDLARTFRLLAEQGDSGFYEGDIARDILRAVNEAPVNPGRMTAGDLASYRAPLRAPVVGTFKGFTVYGMGPPSSGGIAMQQILAILERWPMEAARSSPALSIHRFSQATRLAMADRDAYAADADFIPVPVRGLLDPAYLGRRAESVPWRRPLTVVQAGTPPGAPTAQLGRSEDTEHWSTTHLVVVDAQRNVVSLTATIEQGFGSGMVVPGRGFLLNNEMTDFSAKAIDAQGRPIANRIEAVRRARAGALDIPSSIGGKRPRSSMAPAIVLRDGRPVLAVGSPGGSRIIPYVARVLTSVLEEGTSLQDAINRPHATNLGGSTVIEPELDTASLEEALKPLGHSITVARQASGLHGIWIDPKTGRLHAGIDPRREGAAAGY